MLVHTVVYQVSAKGVKDVLGNGEQNMNLTRDVRVLGKWEPYM